MDSSDPSWPSTAPPARLILAVDPTTPPHHHRSILASAATILTHLPSTTLTSVSVLPSPPSPFDLPTRSLQTLTISLQTLTLTPPISLARSLFFFSLLPDPSLLLLFSSLERFDASAFRSLKEPFRRKEVGIVWVHVGEDEGVGLEEVRREVVGMGWGVSSVDAILVPPKVVPVRLAMASLWGNVGVLRDAGKVRSFRISDVDAVLRRKDVRKGGVELGIEVSNAGVGEKERAELRIEILDVEGRPLEWKCCDLDVVGVGKERFRGSMKVCLKRVVNTCADGFDGVKVKRSVFLRGGGSGKEEGKVEFFGDKVLQLMSDCEGGQFVVGSPAWQVVLCFLCRRDLWALASVSDEEGRTFVGVVKPFTVHSAFLEILEDGEGGVRSIDDVLDDVGVVCESDGVKNGGHSSKRRSRKRLGELFDLSWKAFRELVFSETSGDTVSGLDLEEIYFARKSNISKKMKLVQCWIRQMKKATYFSLRIKNVDHVQLENAEQPEEQLISSQLERESIGEVGFSQSENKETPGAMEDDLQILDEYTIPEKIELGLDQEEVDLGDLAERLVGLTLRTLHVKFQTKKLQDCVADNEVENCDLDVMSALLKVLLVKPKDLAAKYKNSNPTAPVGINKKVREHELQILFRMEILRSSINTSIGGKTRGKIVKEICSILENIEFNLQGNMFAGESLIDFSERTIKARYANSLGEVIHNIYSQMEFLSFDGNEEDDSCPFSNTKDEGAVPAMSDSTKTTTRRSDTIVQKTALIAETSSSHPEADHNSPEGSIDKSRLIQAQQRRERAQRFSHFNSTSHLRRIWAPKKSNKTASLSGETTTKKLERRTRMAHNDMVLETPLSGNKRSLAQEMDSVENLGQGRSKRFLPKVLFPDEDDTQS